MNNALAVPLPTTHPKKGGGRGGPSRMQSMSEPLTDSVLVQRASKGDAIAFSELVSRHYSRCLRVAFGLVKSRQDAEDAVQEAFARVYARLGSFQGGSAFYTWLYRIVFNLSIDCLRRRKRERRVDVEDEAAREALQAGREMWPRFRDEHPAMAAERQDLAERLRKAFQDLPEIHQAVLLLREQEGMSYDEIAQTLRIKRGTVMSRLFHARRAMQAKLNEAAADDKKAAPEGK